MNTPPDQYVDLARALAELPSRQNDEALKAGGLPVDERCRTIIENGIQEIKRRCEQWKTMEQEPELAKALADIAEAGENLLRKAESDAGRQAIAILANEDNWYYPVNFPRYRENIEFLTRAARFHSQTYSSTIPWKLSPTQRENLIWFEIYRLYRRLKWASGGREGIAGPLYRFTKACLGLLDVGTDLRLSELTFRMRIQRVVNARRTRLGSLGESPMNTRQR